ncbi:XcbB/CpsF family capsular polysaccharide biosynthesis protein [Arthrobacter sp. UYEF36]|uniref:XcbB/CpsF family capsular polysaccharide biosynthesis protein n=1 Tax=Arthrobacter sp. UYEF36 TaxID=1756366 RepID=UPI00339269A4
MNDLVLDLADDLSPVIDGTAAIDPSTSYVLVNHGPSSAPGENLITISRRDPAAKRLISHLAMNGFYLYRVTENGSRFVRDHTISKLWHRVKDGDFSTNGDGLIYSLTLPAVKSNFMRILVIFSSMNTSIYTPSMMRYFEQNFRSAQKHVPPNTAILRIADIGGVVGAFYLNTVRNPNNTERIRRLITETATAHQVSFGDVVLYGASKGGTGALYHGLTGGFKCLAVDPVISDDYYVSTYQDSHFTTDGVFPERKQDVFARIIDHALDSDSKTSAEGTKTAVIYSERSPQYGAIQEIAVGKLQGRAAFFNCINPEISDHPDVSPKSLNTAAMLMNMLFYDMELKPGVRRVF